MNDDPQNSPFVMHIICNAHLDPVWLWDWREGFTEAITTTRTILDLMDEYPELTFVRGEAFLYRHIEQNDPATFQRIQKRVEDGRWEIVGGTMLQSDMNLPATETLLRHLVYAQRYFLERFGRKARSGWSADCFGHSAALPDLLAASGIEYYAYTRPFNVPAYNTFWWEGPAGARLLVHHPTIGFYGSERDETPSRLDGLLKQAGEGSIQNIACFMGLGDHGGYPTRRMMADILTWSKEHPEDQVVYSSMQRFFEALREEVGTGEDSRIPVFKGEINFAPRGIYAAAARFKYTFRKAEAAVRRAERIAAGIAGATHTPSFDLHEAWEGVLFNTFHDILPGSSIERAYDEQLDWLGATLHTTRLAEQQAFNTLAARVDTRVRAPGADMPSGVPFLAFNPHPWPFQGYLELEACLDYRPIWKYRGRVADLPVAVYAPGGEALPVQKIESEHLYAQDLALRTRVLVPVTLPAFGWNVMEFAYDEGAPHIPIQAPASVKENEISNSSWTIKANEGEAGIRILQNGQSILDEPGLSAVTVEDRWGTWGDFNESQESTSLTQVRCPWKVTRVAVGEPGPLRATLHVRLEGGRSRLDLLCSLSAGRDVVDISARAWWDERCAQLKLVLPGCFHTAVYDVMGGSVRRGPVGEVPGGRWVHLQGAAGDVGFASNALYGFNLTPQGDLHACVARATRYAADAPAQVDDFYWRPVLDCGELRFRFLLTADIENLPALAEELEQPPLAMPVTPSGGDWPRQESLLAIEPKSVHLLAIKPAEVGQDWILHLQSAAPAAITPLLTWLGQNLPIAPLLPLKVEVIRLHQQEDGRWQAVKNNLLEYLVSDK
jgi:alpha-mannosidase